MATLICSLVFWDTNRHPLTKWPLASLTVLVEVAIQLKEDGCQGGKGSVAPPSGAENVPAVVTEPTLSPKHTVFCTPS